MPYAYVKFLEGTKCGRKYTVETSKIMYKKDNEFFPCKFPDLKFGETKKYYIQNNDDKFDKAQIVFLERTKVEIVDKVGHTRVKFVPVKQLETVSEDDSESNTIIKSKTGIVNMINAKDHQENKLKKYNSLLQAKTNAIHQNHSKSTSNQSQNSTTSTESNAVSPELQELSSSKPKQAGDASQSIIKERENVDAVSPELQELSSSKPKQAGDASQSIIKERENVDDVSLQHLHKPSSASKHKQADSASQSSVEGNTSASKPSKSEKENKASTSSQSSKEDKASTTLESSKASESIASQSLSAARKSHTTPANKIHSTTKGVSAGTDESTKKIQKLLKEVNTFEGKYKKLEQENKKLHKRISALELKIKENDKDLKDYKQLNIDLQKKVIEKMDERQVIQAQPGNCIDMNAKNNFVPIGHYRKTNDTYHVGRDRWLPAGVYDNMMSNTQSPGTCVGSILMVIFGERTLMKSTMTGRISNRKKNKEKNDAIVDSDNKLLSKENNNDNENKENSIEKLDDSKLAICFDLFCHWLKNYYAKINEKFDYFTEMGNFNTYVSKKISYLKRPTQKRKRKEKDGEDNSPVNKKKKARCSPPNSSNDERNKKKVFKKKQKNEEEEVPASSDLDDTEKNIPSIAGSELSEDDEENKDLTPPSVQIDLTDPLAALTDDKEDSDSESFYL